MENISVMQLRYSLIYRRLSLITHIIYCRLRSNQCGHFSWLSFVLALRSIVQQLLVSLTFPSVLDAGTFSSLWLGEKYHSGPRGLIMKSKQMCSFSHFDKALKDIAHTVFQQFLYLEIRARCSARAKKTYWRQCSQKLLKTHLSLGDSMCVGRTGSSLRLCFCSMLSFIQRCL